MMEKEREKHDRKRRKTGDGELIEPQQVANILLYSLAYTLGIFT